MAEILKITDDGVAFGRLFFRDSQNHIATQLHSDARQIYSIDYSAWLADETISSVLYSVSGIVSTSPTNTTTTVSLDVSGSPGDLQVNVTTSAGNINVLNLRFFDEHARLGIARDYDV